MEYTLVRPMAPSAEPSPSAIPQVTVTVPATPPPATVTAPALPAPQVQQWNPTAAPGQGIQVQQMPSVPAAAGGGVTISNIAAWVISFLLVIFVIAGIVSMLKTVLGRERADTKTAAKSFAVVAIASAGIVLLVGQALFTIMNGVVSSLVSGIGG